MKNNNLVTISISAALAAVIFAGCGSSTAPVKGSQNSSEKIETQSQKVPVSQSLNTVTGKIRLDKTPVNNRTTQALTHKVYSVTAYNLDTHSVYKTTTDGSGVYTLAGLSDGDYQIYAKNDEVAKSAIKRVTLSRGTRKVVDFVLQAAGSLKGQIKGAHVVYIPGKDYVTIPDDNGYFELTNIPVGTYELAYEVDLPDRYDYPGYNYDDHDNTQTGTMTVTVKEGMTDLAQITPTFDLFDLDTRLPLGTLQLHHDGIHFDIDNPWGVNYDAFAKAISLEDASGKKIPVEVQMHYGSSGVIKTEQTVPAGDYTVKIPASVSDLMDKDFVKTFHVDAVSVAMTENNRGARYINLVLPVKLDDTQKAALGTIAVKEKGSTATLPVKAVWSDDETLSLFGNYKTGVEYVLDLTDAQKAVVGNVKTMDNKLMFGEVKFAGLYPADGSKETGIDQKVYVNIKNIKELDPASVKFTVSDGTETKTYEKGDIVFSNSRSMVEPYYGGESYAMRSSEGYDKYNYFNGYDAAAGIKDANLSYGKTYSVTVDAKDVYGNALHAESSFSTLTPEVTDLSPHDFEDLFREDLRARFNVDIDKESGTITVEDLTDPSANPEVKIAEDVSEDHEDKDKYEPYNDNYKYQDPKAIAFKIEGLQPEHQYKVTVSGFKSKDGADIPARTTQFNTPPKMLFIPEEYQQNLFVNPQNFEHKVRFFVFGGLSDAEKAFMETHLQVTSYGTAKAPDATHPERKLFFLNDADGVEVVVAFTIDPNSNYEISFDDVSGLSGIVMPKGFEANKPLFSFSTQKMVDSGQGNYGEVAIRNMEVFAEGNDAQLNLDISLPLGEIPQNESCWNRYEDVPRMFNLVDYVHVEDQDHKEVTVAPDKYNNALWLDERYQKETKLCSLSGNVHGMFPVDYNSSYTVTADFTKDFAGKGIGGLSLSKVLQTAPIGQMDYWVDDNGGKDAILFHVRANAPIANPEILKVVMDGVEYRPETNDGFVEPGDKNSSGIMQAMPMGDIMFVLPRPLYSLITFTLQKDDGTVLKFIKDEQGTQVERADLLVTPKKFTESVSPDFVPVKTQTVHTQTTANKFVIAEFNRPLRMQDIVTYSDANKTEISDIAFEIKDSDGNAVVITDVGQMDNAVGFALSQELNTSKNYTLSLKNGKEVHAAFGVQKLTAFSHPVDLTVINVKDAFIIQRNYAFDLNVPFDMGATQSRQADYINQVALVIPVEMAADVSLQPDKMSINAQTNYGRILNQGTLVVHNGKLIQPLTDSYDSVNADVKVAYTYQNQNKLYQKSLKNISRVHVADLKSIAGEGVNQLRFDFSMDPQPITEENFRVFHEDGTPATGVTLSVQVDPNNINSAVVTFDGLAPDTAYIVKVFGLSAYGNPVPADAMVSQVKIKTPAQ